MRRRLPSKVWGPCRLVRRSPPGHNGWGHCGGTVVTELSRWGSEFFPNGSFRAVGKRAVDASRGLLNSTATGGLGTAHDRFAIALARPQQIVGYAAIAILLGVTAYSGI